MTNPNRPLTEHPIPMPEGWQPPLIYFVDTGDGIEYHATEQDAKEAAAAVLKWCRKEAAKCGEWPDDVERICYGRIIGMVSAKVTGDEGQYVDYELEDTKGTE